MSTNNPKLLSHFSPVFPVKNVSETLLWYEEQLDFTTDFKWQNPPTYAVISREEIKIHLTEKEDDFEPSKTHTAIYIFVHDVDLLFQEFKAKGLVKGELENAEYGMRDFDLVDLNGFRLTFGQSVS
ncbi:VOC family protein [Roseivirga sp.]|uniref:VOC family protein n=1 Tax=Roseivirga sp. TaxID=1964215 RepID=UPI003B8CD4B7